MRSSSTSSPISCIRTIHRASTSSRTVTRVNTRRRSSLKVTPWVWNEPPRTLSEGMELVDEGLPTFLSDSLPGLALREGIETEPVHEVTEACVDPRGHLFEGTDDCERIQNVVVDQLAHGVPTALLGELVQLGRKVPPAMELKDRPVAGRRTIERDLPAGRALDFFGKRRVFEDDEAAVRDGQVLPLLPRSLCAREEHRNGHFPHEPLGAEAMSDDAICDFAGDLAHMASNCGDIDGRGPVLAGPLCEERRHEGVGIELPLEVELRSLLPRFPDRADGEDHLSHPRRRMGPGHRVAPSDVGLDLGAQPQH